MDFMESIVSLLSLGLTLMGFTLIEPLMLRRLVARSSLVGNFIHLVL